MYTNGRNKGKHRERHDFVYKWPIINGGKWKENEINFGIVFLSFFFSRETKLILQCRFKVQYSNDILTLND